MPDLKIIVPKADRAFLAKPERIAPEDPKQRKLMVGALFLLLLSLGIVLWHDRDFWLPDPPQAESEQPVESFRTAKVTPLPPTVTVPTSDRRAKSKHPMAGQANIPVPPLPASPVAASTARTVLPPLEVEVVAGDTHRTIRPGSSSVQVDVQPDTRPQPITGAGVIGDAEGAAHVTSTAAERVRMSTDTSEIVTGPVRPNYPLLARQMKVQGSVILQAMISKDGTIQNLRVMSGPHILASAAQDAVRQWHFKPHFEGREAVETQAKITVNFTISTN